jgi:hypothetical protein
MRLNANAGFNSWEQNQQITIPGVGALHSSYRPALAVVNNLMHMVYQGEGGFGLLWSWFDGNVWSGNVQLPVAYEFPIGPGQYSLQQCQPCLCIDSNSAMHLVYHTDLVAPGGSSPPGAIPNQLRHGIFTPSATGPSVSSWSAPDVVSQDLSHPAIAPFGRTFALTATSAVNKANSEDLQFAQWLPGQLAQFEPLGSVLSTDGGVLLNFNSLLYSVYIGHEHRNIWYAWLNNNSATPAGNQRVKGPGFSAETSAPVGAALFNGDVCIAYKGQDSDNFWFTHGH